MMSGPTPQNHAWLPRADQAENAQRAFAGMLAASAFDSIHCEQKGVDGAWGVYSRFPWHSLFLPHGPTTVNLKTEQRLHLPY